MADSGPMDTPPVILIVDDSEFTLRALTRMFRQEYVKVVAHDGSGSVARVLDGQVPSAAIIDWHLHNSNAAELISTLATTYPNCPTLVASGDARPETQTAAKRAGAWAWHSKTDGPTQLIETVDQALAEHRRRTTREGYPTLDEMTATAISGALVWSGGNLTAAAQNLGISRDRLRRLIQKLDLAA